MAAAATTHRPTTPAQRAGSTRLQMDLTFHPALSFHRFPALTRLPWTELGQEAEENCGLASKLTQQMGRKDG